MTDARSPLRRKLRAQIADSILDAAEEVALELGVGGMTIAAVAARAGVAVGTLYNYYPDGEGILAALFRARRASLLPLIAAAVAATKTLPFETRLRELVRQPARRLREPRPLRAPRGARRPRQQPLQAARHALRDATIAALEPVMREGARRRLFAARQASTYARMMHGALRSLFLWRASPAEPIAQKASCSSSIPARRDAALTIVPSRGQCRRSDSVCEAGEAERTRSGRPGVRSADGLRREKRSDECRRSDSNRQAREGGGF